MIGVKLERGEGEDRDSQWVIGTREWVSARVEAYRQAGWVTAMLYTPGA